MPLRLTRPGVGRKATTSFQAPGRRMEANVSSPTATAEKFALVAHPEPPDEPPTVRSRSYGLCEAPNIDPNVSPGLESLEVKLVTEDEVPWDQLAFAMVKRTLEHFFEARKNGAFVTRFGDIRPPGR